MWILFCRRQEEVPAFAGKTDGETVREDRWRGRAGRQMMKKPLFYDVRSSVLVFRILENEPPDCLPGLEPGSPLY